MGASASVQRPPQQQKSSAATSKPLRQPLPPAPPVLPVGGSQPSSVQPYSPFLQQAPAGPAAAAAVAAAPVAAASPAAHMPQPPLEVSLFFQIVNVLRDCPDKKWVPRAGTTYSINEYSRGAAREEALQIRLPGQATRVYAVSQTTGRLCEFIDGSKTVLSPRAAVISLVLFAGVLSEFRNRDGFLETRSGRNFTDLPDHKVDTSDPQPEAAARPAGPAFFHGKRSSRDLKTCGDFHLKRLPHGKSLLYIHTGVDHYPVSTYVLDGSALREAVFMRNGERVQLRVSASNVEMPYKIIDFLFKPMIQIRMPLVDVSEASRNDSEASLSQQMALCTVMDPLTYSPLSKGERFVFLDRDQNPIRNPDGKIEVYDRRTIMTVCLHTGKEPILQQPFYGIASVEILKPS